MLANTPTPAMLEELLGPALFPVWQQLCRTIEERYDMERLWNSGGKNWTYEYKYRRGGKRSVRQKPLPGVPGDFRERGAGQSGSHLGGPLPGYPRPV